MASIRELAEEHWNGRGDLVHAHHPVQPVHVHHDDGSRETASEEIEEGILTLKSIASASTTTSSPPDICLQTNELTSWRRCTGSHRTRRCLH